MIDLTPLSPQASAPRLLDFGGFLTPSTGAPVQRVDRLGNRHAHDVTLPPMRAEPDGRVWVSRLKRAKTEGAFMRFPQVGFRNRVSGSPIVAAPVAAGRSLPVAGLGARCVIREGQWLSIIHGGRRYLHSVDAEIVAGADGTVTLAITPLLRTSLDTGDVIELAQPRIEGLILEDFGWSIDKARTVGLSFTITEAA